MKDPYTLAFEIKWLGLMIWHRDRHGSDGACGWTYPHLTDRQFRALRDLAWCEGRTPYFLRSPGKVFNGSRADAECLYRALIFNVALSIGHRVTFDYATREAIMKIHRGADFSGANVFCWQPGYHSNFTEDSADSREQHFRCIVGGIAREILADHRPWFKHPRWHMHHWRLQWRVLQWFKLHVIYRCALCGKRFGRKEYPTSDWNGTRHWHVECFDRRLQPSPRR